MSEVLKKIDADLIDSEERLLADLRRVRKLELEDRYCSIEEDLRQELWLTIDALKDALNKSGDLTNISLETEEHEAIRERIMITRSLMSKMIPTAFLKASHSEARSGRIDDDAHWAAKELAILDQQVRSHHDDGESIEDVIRGRAEFNARELSRGHAQERVKQGGGIAQSPEEIRRKLQERGTQSAGSSVFTARDVSHANESAPTKPPPAAKRDIAQSPEEIRRKLAERQAAAAGKAVFGAKDIEPVAPVTPAAKEAPKAPPAGRAVFGAKDIEHVQEKFSPKPPEKKPEEKKPEPEKPKGRAIFEARDLSDPKP